MKTSEEIKKGLECCAKGNSCRGHCPYDGRSAGIKECTSQLARDALTLIPRWISVEERLPEECLYVIVYLQNKRTDNKDIWHIDADFYEDGDWHRYPERGYYNVTHWMPLPEPPKEV